MPGNSSTGPEAEGAHPRRILQGVIPELAGASGLGEVQIYHEQYTVPGVVIHTLLQ